jgi:hypothetical protein
MKAIVCMRFAIVVLLVAGRNSRSCALRSVTLASKSSGELPRGPDFTCHSHSYCDLTYCFLPRSSKDCKTTVTMVYYFTSNAVKPSAYIYVGKDKVESAIPASPTHLKHTLLTA